MEKIAINMSDNDKLTRNRRKSLDERLPRIRTNIDITLPNNAKPAVTVYNNVKNNCRFLLAISRLSILNESSNMMLRFSDVDIVVTAVADVVVDSIDDGAVILIMEIVLKFKFSIRSNH